MEYASKGSLFHNLHAINAEPFSEKRIGEIFAKVASAVHLLHSKNIVHRDIKPENILLDSDFSPKLCDFGWSVKLRPGEQRNTFCGTYEYMAPEIFDNEKYGFPVDVWSLGVLLYELHHREAPFTGKSVFQII